MVSDDTPCCSESNEFISNELKEMEEIRNLIKLLAKQDLSERQMELNLDRFNFIIRQYQDQPQLLDSYLEDILAPLIGSIRNSPNINCDKHYVFKYLYVVISVKTHKKIVMHLPHEVTDFIPVLQMLENQDPEDKVNWQTRYVLLVWLSIICKIPFPLTRLEYERDLDKTSAIERLLRVCKVYCDTKDACFTAAVPLVTNFLSRSDVKDEYIKDIITWCLEKVSEDPSNHRPLAILASILKHCHKNDLESYSQLLLDNITYFKPHTNPEDLVRKYSLKVIQRIGLLLLTRLKPQSQANAAKSSQTNDHNRNAAAAVTNNDEEDQEDTPSVIEDILERLIQCLNDKTIMIRWSAAKGIGRISALLPEDLSDEVLGCVLNLFTDNQSETALHGGCLALAELGRRGLLSTSRLKEIINLVLKALVFDEPRAYGPVGSIIRDAACFVCWSFSRAFSPQSLSPFINDVVLSLLLVSCFDREINCRRAASAALQEIIGRQENFPFGIELITTADYFAVGVRSNSYLNISTNVASLLGCTKFFIDHVVEKKVVHWDESIREISSKALHNLIENEVDYAVREIVPKLLSYVSSSELIVRHGAMLAIAEILLAIHEKTNNDMTGLFDESELEKIRNIVTLSKSQGEFRGFGGDLIRKGCILLIKNFAVVHFPVRSYDVIVTWQNLLEDCLSSDDKTIRSAASEAHGAFFVEYYFQLPLNMRKDVILRYMTNLRSYNQQIRAGYIQAVGYLPQIVIKDNAQEILDTLIFCTYKEQKTMLWAESRKEAIYSLVNICCVTEIKDSEFWRPFIINIYTCFLNGLEDYTNDNRGDIGSWVREASMNGLHALTKLVANSELNILLNEDLMKNIIGGIAKQALERLDKLRAQAGLIFYSLICSDLPNIPYHKNLKLLFSESECGKKIDWKTENETFPLFIKMLDFPPYVTYILSGIVYSVGGISESLVKHSCSTLFNYLSQLDSATLHKFCNEVTLVFENRHGDERMLTSLLSFLDRLFSTGSLQRIINENENEVFKAWLKLIKRESKSLKSMPSQLNIIKLYCHLLQVRDTGVSREAFGQLSIYLCHKFKYLRKATALKLYEALLLYGEDMDIQDQDLSILLNQLNSTNWEKPIEDIKPIRNQLCEIMRSPIPVVHQK